MAFSIIYKRLFEVHILHRYYFPVDQVDSFFEMTKEAQMQALQKVNYNILNDISIQPTAACQKILEGQRMRFLATPFGFIVGIQVKENDTGEVEPLLSLDEGVTFTFDIKIRNQQWANFTNQRLQGPLRANYFFTNAPENENLNFPNLAFSPYDYNEERKYEMGEIVQSDGTQYIAVTRVDLNSIPAVNPDNWEELAGPEGWITNANQKLLPQRFKYTLPIPQEIEGDSIELFVDGDVTPISPKEILTGQLKELNLDFSEVNPGPYVLHIETDEVSEEQFILLDDQRFDRNILGKVEIKHQSGLDDFRLLEADGTLKKVDDELTHPIFELRFLNRSTYWEYVLIDEETIAPDTDDDYQILEEEGQVKIITKSPQPILKEFQAIDFDEIPLPNPTNLMIQPRKDGKNYSEIFIKKLTS